MAIKYLDPIKEKPSDYDDLESHIRDIFREYIYLPLLKELDKEDMLENSKDDLVRAIQKGRITYYRGHFYGKLNATLSRELRGIGAKWDKTTGTFRLPISKIPHPIRIAIEVSSSRFAKVIEKIDEALGKIFPEQVAKHLKSKDFFDKRLWDVENKISETLKGIKVLPRLNSKERQKISEEYTEDLQKYIINFTEKEIGELRKRVNKSFFLGDRYEKLAETIQDSYGVSMRKAKFLARQETGLLMAKFKETRYTEADVKEYQWKCVAGSKNHPVRPMHKALDGRIFSWSNPPVTSPKGQRNNPGEDYNCRCYARPVIKF